MGRILRYKHGSSSISRVDPRLWDIVQHAIAAQPYDAIIRSGSERGKGDKGNHSKGYAIDVTLVDKDGHILPDTVGKNAGATFAAYETYAQAARVYQKETYPELNKVFRWGGGFLQGGTPGDLMHLDITPRAGGAMALYSWDKGLGYSSSGKRITLPASFASATSNGGLGGFDGSRRYAQLRMKIETIGLLPPMNVPDVASEIDVRAPGSAYSTAAARAIRDNASFGVRSAEGLAGKLSFEDMAKGSLEVGAYGLGALSDDRTAALLGSQDSMFDPVGEGPESWFGIMPVDDHENPNGGMVFPVARPAALVIPGLIEMGNIDLSSRPVFRQPNGAISTENSISIGTDRGEVLIPTIIDGKQVSTAAAIAHFQRTGENLGTFIDAKTATAYALDLHERQAERYGVTPPPDAPAPLTKEERHRILMEQQSPDPNRNAPGKTILTGIITHAITGAVSNISIPAIDPIEVRSSAGTAALKFGDQARGAAQNIANSALGFLAGMGGPRPVDGISLEARDERNGRVVMEVSGEPYLQRATIPKLERINYTPQPFRVAPVEFTFKAPKTLGEALAGTSYQTLAASMDNHFRKPDPVLTEQQKTLQDIHDKRETVTVPPPSGAIIRTTSQKAGIVPLPANVRPKIPALPPVYEPDMLGRGLPATRTIVENKINPDYVAWQKTYGHVAEVNPKAVATLEDIHDRRDAAAVTATSRVTPVAAPPAPPRTIPVSRQVPVRSKPVVTVKPGNKYVAQEGDTLSQIAAAHGVKLAEIVRANGIQDANKIRAGQSLLIPGRTASVVAGSSTKSSGAPAPKNSVTPKQPIFVNKKGERLAPVKISVYNDDTHQFEDRTVYRPVA